MRIWIVHQHAIPPIVMGPTRHFDLAKKLIEQGHEVFILAGNYCHNSFLYIAEPYSLTNKIAYYSDVPFIWFGVPGYKKNSLKRLFNMTVFAYKLRTCKQLKFIPKPDVIIGSSPSPLAALAAQHLATRFKVPFIYEIRDLWPATLRSLGSFSKYHPLIYVFQRIEDRLLTQASKIISVLPGVKDYLQTKQISSDKLMWLPNAVDISQIKYRLPINREVIHILYAGSFNISNDIETLLYAAKILQNCTEINFKIQLMGDGPRKADLTELVKLKQILNVEFIPTVGKERIYDVLASADICVGMVRKTNLYQYGTSLNKITDYLAIARPVVFALDSPYSPITEANAGLTVEPESPTALAQALLKIASLSYEERKQLGLNGRKYAQQHYDMAKIAASLIDHIKI